MRLGIIGGGGGSGFEDDGGSVVGDGEGFAGGEGVESGAGEAEAAAVVRVRRRKVVARVNGIFHETTPFLAAPHGFLVVEFRRRATHFWLVYRILYSNRYKIIIKI